MEHEAYVGQDNQHEREQLAWMNLEWEMASQLVRCSPPKALHVGNLPDYHWQTLHNPIWHFQIVELYLIGLEAFGLLVTQRLIRILKMTLDYREAPA